MRQWIGPSIIGIALVILFGIWLVSVPNWFRSTPEQNQERILEQKIKEFEAEKRKIREEIRAAKAAAAKETAAARAAINSAARFRERASQLEQQLQEAKQRELPPVRSPEEAFKRLEDLGWLAK